MKAKLFDVTGQEKSTIELPEIFSSDIREDLAQKYFEVEKYELRQPYTSYDEAGKRHSASGTISHLRHTWKGHYGKGMARLPRKTMYRRGTQFFWVGAEVANTRGGRRAHPPSGVYGLKKINKKERRLAFQTGYAATADSKLILSRYSSLSKFNFTPSVIESIPAKSKDLISAINKIFKDTQSIIIKERKVRPGVGKQRGRRYKSNAGLLIVIGNEEKAKCSTLEIKRYSDVTMKDLFPLGRLTLYTKKALEEMKNVA